MEALQSCQQELQDKEQHLHALSATESQQRQVLERLRQELAKAQEASKQLAASSQAAAVASAEEVARLERDLSAVRAAHAKAVERSSQVGFKFSLSKQSPVLNTRLLAQFPCLSCSC